MIEMLRRGIGPLRAPEEDASGGSGGDAPEGADGGEGAPSGDGGEDGSSSSSTKSYPDFHNQYPAYLRGHDALKSEDGSWLSPGDIVKTAVEYREKRGKLVEVPGEDATPEQRDAFARKIGRPDGPDGYELQKPEDWPNTVPWPADLAKKFAEQAYTAGLTKHQAMRMFIQETGAFRSRFLQEMDSRQQRQQQWDEELRGEYKDNLDSALHTADRAMTLIGEPSVVEALKSAGLNRHPGIVRMLNKAWRSIGEDKIFSGAVDANASTNSTKERIRSRYSKTQFSGA